MNIISLNTNKRLGNPDVKAAAQQWLSALNCDLFVVQEPWKLSNPPTIEFEGFDSIPGQGNVHAWARKGFGLQVLEESIENCQVILVGHLKLFNMYLSAYSKKDRIRSYKWIQRSIENDIDAPALLVGDFNTAPGPTDGLFGGVESTWTDSHERKAFITMLKSTKLVDTTSPNALGIQEFSIERHLRGKKVLFRCDLALASDTIAPDIVVRYDHTVRQEPRRFTDHSALVVEIPVGLDREDLLPFIETQDLYFPHKTAMARSGPSNIAKWIVSSDFCRTQGISSVLDYGCGRGQDVSYYRSEGLSADGYDPHDPFGWSDVPTKKYLLITMVFVVNVLASPQLRLAAIREACEHLREGGVLLIAARSPKTILKEATQKGWLPHNDGYWSHKGRRTFQKGISEAELRVLMERCGLEILKETCNFGAEVSCLIGRMH